MINCMSSCVLCCVLSVANLYFRLCTKQRFIYHSIDYDKPPLLESVPNLAISDIFIWILI